MEIRRPNHIAMTLGGHFAYSKKNKLPIEETYKEMFIKIEEILKLQIRLNIPIFTLYVVTSNVKESEHFSSIMDALMGFFENFKNDDLLFKNKVKISVLGKWYDLPGRVVDSIKGIIEETREYDDFFFNLCINYDGQEEIVDACRLMARKIQAGKIDPDSIDKESIKDNIYSSYFLPPDIIIKTGKDKKLNGFLLWDSIDSHIFLSNKLWLDLTKEDIDKAIKDWTKTIDDS